VSGSIIDDMVYWALHSLGRWKRSIYPPQHAQLALHGSCTHLQISDQETCTIGYLVGCVWLHFRIYGDDKFKDAVY
jgi:hypothetical protein